MKGSSYFSAAFDRVCHEAESASDRFVSLYERTSSYGGPEEGGWWRHDVHLVKTARFSSLDTAERVAERIASVATQLSAEAKRRWAEHCSREVDWCEARGLDADYLGEPDGPSEFFVVIEEVAGSRESRGPSHYE